MLYYFKNFLTALKCEESYCYSFFFLIKYHGIIYKDDYLLQSSLECSETIRSGLSVFHKSLGAQF